jgi:hypothetical protein
VLVKFTTHRYMSMRGNWVVGEWLSWRSLSSRVGATFGCRPRRSSLAVTTLKLERHIALASRSTTRTTTPFAGSVAATPTPGWRDSGAPWISYVTGSEMKTQYSMRFTFNGSFFTFQVACP